MDVIGIKTGMTRPTMLQEATALSDTIVKFTRDHPQYADFDLAMGLMLKGPVHVRFTASGDDDFVTFTIVETRLSYSYAVDALVFAEAASYTFN